jgi:hypothetical protein
VENGRIKRVHFRISKLKAGFEFNHAGYKEIHPNRYQNVQCDFIHGPKNIKN